MALTTSVREFLDRGIEYSEIHEVHFRPVALRHGIDLVPDSPVALASAAARQRTASSPSRVMSPRTSQADCPYALKSDFDKAELDKLLKSFESVIKRQRDRSISQRLRHELLDADPPSVSFGTTDRPWARRSMKSALPSCFRGLECSPGASRRPLRGRLAKNARRAPATTLTGQSPPASSESASRTMSACSTQR